jgi:glycosyltransferase involved in cell wall biosynthesis
VPHGVNQKIYKPIPTIRRKQFRDALKVEAGEFLILSLGAMTQNKGVDILIAAFANLKTKYPHLKLVLKDSSNLYGIRMRDILKDLKKQNSDLITESVYDSIVSLSDNLTQSQLNGLYGAADCYVSPYRAEGFNLAPLEAAASGTPILITKGGSTDDYFHETLGLQIESVFHKNQNAAYLEPSLDSLIDQLSILIEDKASKLNSVFTQQFIANNFSWDVVTKKLINLF